MRILVLQMGYSTTTGHHWHSQKGNLVIAVVCYYVLAETTAPLLLWFYDLVGTIARKIDMLTLERW